MPLGGADGIALAVVLVLYVTGTYDVVDMTGDVAQGDGKGEVNV